MKRKMKFVIFICLSMLMPKVMIHAEETLTNEAEAFSLTENWQDCNQCDENHPHQITTLKELDKIRTHTIEINGSTYINGYFTLSNDLIFTDSDFEKDGLFYNDGRGWTPIGHNNKSNAGVYFADSSKFIGYLDGSGYTIEGLKIKRENGYWYNGLFAGIAGGVIKNLVLKNFDIHADGAGVLCGQVFDIDAFAPTAVSNIRIENCNIENLSTAAKPSGLLIGAINSGNFDEIMIENSSLITHSSWRGSFIASEMHKGNITNVTVSDCYLEPYAYFGMLVSYAGPDTHLKNIVVENSIIKPTHWNHRFLVYEGKANSEQPAVLENIFVDVKIIGNSGYSASENQYSAGLLPYPHDDYDETSYQLKNSIIRLNVTEAEHKVKPTINLSESSVPQESMCNVYVQTKDGSDIIQSEYINDTINNLDLSAFTNQTMKTNETYQLMETMIPGIELISSDAAIAEVENGTVKANHSGIARVSAVMKSINQPLAEAEIIVNKIPVQISMPDQIRYSLSDTLQSPFFGDIENVLFSIDNADLRSAIRYRWFDEGVMSVHPYLPMKAGETELEMYFDETSDYVIAGAENGVLSTAVYCQNDLLPAYLADAPALSSVYTYDGSPKGTFSTSQLSYDQGDFNQLMVHYYGLNDTDYEAHGNTNKNESIIAAAPAKPGMYKLIINGESSDQRYYLYWEKLFAIKVQEENHQSASSTANKVLSSKDGSGQWFIRSKDKVRFKDKENRFAVGYYHIDDHYYYFDEQTYLVFDRFIQLDDALYFADEEGKLASAWKFIDNKWYFFEADAKAANRWVAHYQDWYKIEEGVMLCSKWLAGNEGKWYYVGSDGAMVRNQYVDGCYIDENGIYLSPLYH